MIDRVGVIDRVGEIDRVVDKITYDEENDRRAQREEYNTVIILGGV